MRTKMWVEFIFTALIGLYVSACGQDTSGMRGAFGYTSTGGGNLQQQSLTGFYCVATPAKMVVASNESFSVQVMVYGASGNVSLPGLNASGSGGAYTFTTKYNNTYGTDVYWQPSITATDGSSQAKCSFTVLVQGGSYRRL